MIMNGQGKLKLGSTQVNLKHSRSTANNSDIGNKQVSVGPTDYDPIKVTKRIPATVIKDTIIPEPALGNVRDQMEFYLNKIFDTKGKSVSNKNTNMSVEFHQPSRTAPKTMEEISPFTTDKRDVAYKSSIGRDPLAPSKDELKGPGPGSYNP